MTDFEFYNPVKVFFGKDQLPKISTQIPAGSKVMFLYGGGSIIKNGVYDRVKAALERFEVTEFGGIEPNPLYETAMKAVEIAKEKNIDFLLAVGGGSVIDATKFIAAAIPYRFGDPWNILAKGMPVAAAVPLGVVLTLPATGSEMNKNAVISRKSTDEKLSFGSPMVFPKFSFLLPDAAGTLPKRQVANGIVDAFVHVTEQYLTYPVNAPIQDRFAEAILITLIEQAPAVYENPADYKAMSNLMWSATMALNGLIQCGVPGDWSVHSIGHELTALHGIDHARTLAIVLPGLWKALLEEKKTKLVQYGERVWNITEGTDDERALKAIDETVAFFESLGVPTRLSAYNVKADTIDKIVSRFEDRKWLELGDRGLTTPEATRKALTLQL
ncbi:MAG: iron-containing alcohol dehydrogenase [Lentimicrobiaceae bacterium]|nr:iron-containing alcohol dehydrogenase [Lentimicrobiaceae bacterium]